VLDTLAVGARTEMLVGLVESELDLQQVEKRIRGRIKKPDGEEPARVLP